MVRTKITARIPPDLADTLRRLAILSDRSISEVVEDAILKAFAARGASEHAALMVKLDQITRRLSTLERSQETHFELSAHLARFIMSITPDIPDADRAGLNARGSTRFQNVVQAIAKRLAGGRGVWRETFLDPVVETSPGVAAE